MNHAYDIDYDLVKETCEREVSRFAGAKKVEVLCGEKNVPVDGAGLLQNKGRGAQGGDGCGKIIGDLRSLPQVYVVQTVHPDPNPHPGQWGGVRPGSPGVYPKWTRISSPAETPLAFVIFAIVSLVILIVVPPVQNLTPCWMCLHTSLLYWDIR